MEFAARVAKYKNRQLVLENVESQELNVPLIEGPVRGPDSSRLLREVAAQAEHDALADIHVVETKRKIIIGKGKRRG